MLLFSQLCKIVRNRWTGEIILAMELHQVLQRGRRAAAGNRGGGLPPGPAPAGSGVPPPGLLVPAGAAREADRGRGERRGPAAVGRLRPGRLLPVREHLVVARAAGAGGPIRPRGPGHLPWRRAAERDLDRGQLVLQRPPEQADLRPRATRPRRRGPPARRGARPAPVGRIALSR